MSKKLYVPDRILAQKAKSDFIKLYQKAFDNKDEPNEEL